MCVDALCTKRRRCVRVWAVTVGNMPPSPNNGNDKGWAGIETPEVSHCGSSLSGDDAAAKHAGNVGERLLSLANACAMCEVTLEYHVECCACASIL